MTMRKVVSFAVVLVMGIMMACAAAAAKDEKPMTMNGWISDSVCGMKNAATAKGAECAAMCVKEKGASWVFVDAKTKKVYKIQNQDAVNASADLGKNVSVSATMPDANTVHVEKISPAKL
jgi:hypothetical protein